MSSIFERLEDGTVVETKTLVKEYAETSIDAEIEQIDNIMANYQAQKDDLLAKKAAISKVAVTAGKVRNADRIRE